jgi:hypothetical protein
LEHPKIEELNKSIVGWIGKNFVKAVLQHHYMKDDFKLARVTRISKVWKDDDHWIVDAHIEYELGSSKMHKITFQVDSEGHIVGYDISEPYDL